MKHMAMLIYKTLPDFVLKNFMWVFEIYTINLFNGEGFLMGTVL